MVGRGLAPATGFAVNSETGTDGSLHTKNNASVGGGEIPLLGEMSRSDKGVMAQP